MTHENVRSHHPIKEYVPQALQGAAHLIVAEDAPYNLGQHRTIPTLRLKHRSGGSPRQEPPQAAVALRSASLRLGVRHGICVAKMLDNVGLRYPHRASGQKPLALCDRCPCFGSLYPPLAALTFAASSIICAFGLAVAAPRSPYRRLELCGIAFTSAYRPESAGNTTASRREIPARPDGQSAGRRSEQETAAPTRRGLGI